MTTVTAEEIDSIYNEALPEGLRVPPHSIEAELSVLGGLMLNNSAWDRIVDKVSDNEFYRKDHRYIFAAIRDLSNDGKPADAVTVAEHLEHAGDLETAGGMDTIVRITQDVPGSANIEAYADIVRERAILRDLISAGSDIVSEVFNPAGRDSKELLELAEKRIFDIAERNSKTGGSFADMKELVLGAIERIDELYNSGQSITGLSTGLDELDEKTSGFQNGDLIILAARPSMGKTALALNFAEHVALFEKKAVAVFSMEMPDQQLAMRLLASNARIDQSRIRDGKLQTEDWPRLTAAANMLSQAPIFIDDEGGLSPAELRARARRLKRENDLGLIVIDYLQLMTVPGTKEGRTAEISEISRSLKALAKELDIPVIALSQLNRGLESRTDKRPMNSDLRESGGIEQDADVILFIYRDEYYNPNTDNPGVSEIIIGKQRNGPIGKVPAVFHGQFTRFENLPKGMDGWGGDE
jgi:replicative DNA helicase